MATKVTKEDIERHTKAIKGSLRYERNRNGRSQAALAEEIGVNQSTLSAWETGDGSVGLEEAWRIADVYGITLDQLAGRESPKGVA